MKVTKLSTGDGRYQVEAEGGSNWWSVNALANWPGGWLITNRKGIEVSATGKLGGRILKAIQDYEKKQVAELLDPVEHVVIPNGDAPRRYSFEVESKPHLELVEDITNNADLSKVDDQTAQDLEDIIRRGLALITHLEETDTAATG